MLRAIFKNYKDFPKEIWIIAIMTLVNRMGTVVIPFLSKYLKEELHFSYSQVGWIMVCFGIGSLAGTFLSGKLCDKIGSYKVMTFSLLTSGIIFLLLMHIKTFEWLCLSILTLTSIADMYRPAMMLTVKNYAKGDLWLKSLSLIRSATNLGFVIGPVLGGLLIINIGYDVLFIVDGITCITAIIIFMALVREQKLLFESTKKNLQPQDRTIPLRDVPFLLNWLIAMVTGYLFFQVFSILPIYHKEVYHLSEVDTGIYLGFSGIIFILFEVSVINFFQKKKVMSLVAVMIGLLLIGFSYSLLFMIHKSWIFWIFITLITFGNMLTFSFASDFVVKRSHKNLEGVFMSIFQMSYGFAHIFSSKIGLTIIQYYDFDTNWIFNFVLAIIGSLIAYLIFYLVKKEKEKRNNEISTNLFSNTI